MKGDYSRLTFDPRDNVRAVLYQQGRPLDEASLNEASAVVLRRIEAEALDVIGESGAPLHGGGFRIVRNAGELTAEEAADPRNQATIPGPFPFLLTAGRLYVDGMQIENHKICAVTAQPPPTAAPPALGTDGRKLIYLTALIDHRTGVEMPRLLDPSFGDADTTTRTLVTWQVRALSVGAGIGCDSSVADWASLVAPMNGRVKVSVDTGAAATDPCKLTAGAGYTRAENLFYRLEADSGVALATIDGEPRFQRDGLVVKVSRNDAAEVAKVVTVNGNDIVVDVDTRDGMPVFRVDEYVEVLEPDDVTGIGVQRGWARIEAVSGERITLAAGHNALVGTRVRLWSTDRITLNAGNAFSLTLDGIKFEFLNDGYTRGTYFLIPARYAIADVLLTNEQRAALPPSGPEVHYTRLGLVDILGGAVQTVTDCRNIFEPLSEQLMFQYVGGDSQEALPGAQLRQPLTVRVSHGRFPLAGATVRFKVESGAGQVVGALAGQPLDVVTNADGIASCQWVLDANPLDAARSQSLSARLLDMTALPTPAPFAGHVVLFGATASATIVHRAGDGQEAAAGTQLEQPLEVRIANEQTPLVGARVEFVVLSGAGVITTAMPVVTDANGSASARWQLGAGGLQQAEARWTDSTGVVVQTVAFDAQVRPAAGGCAITIEPGKKFNTELLKKLLDENRGNVCVCFAAGEHKIEDLKLDAARQRLSIHGCGKASVIELGTRVELNGFASIDIDNLTIQAKEGLQDTGFDFTKVASLQLERLFVTAVNPGAEPFLHFTAVRRVSLHDCVVQMKLPGSCAIFEDADANVDVTGCDLNGLVSFYGPPVSSNLPPQKIDPDKLRQALTAPNRLQPGRGRLRLEANRFDALVLSRDMAARLNDLVSNPAQNIAGLFVDALIVGNTFAFVGTQLLATYSSVTGNTFIGEHGPNNIAALFIGNIIGCSGNVGAILKDSYAVQLVTPPSQSREAGNAVFVKVS